MEKITFTTKKGNEVVIRETTGLDEIIATKMLGSKFTVDAAGATLYRMVMAHSSVVSINGEEVPNPKSIKEVEAFWAKFTSKEKAEIMEKYGKLNEYIPEEDEQVKN